MAWWSEKDPRWQTMPLEEYNKITMPQVIRMIPDPKKQEAVKSIITDMGMNDMLAVGDSALAKLHRGPSGPALLRLRSTKPGDPAKMKKFWEEAGKIIPDPNIQALK